MHQRYYIRISLAPGPPRWSEPPSRRLIPEYQLLEGLSRTKGGVAATTTPPISFGDWAGARIPTRSPIVAPDSPSGVLGGVLRAYVPEGLGAELCPAGREIVSPVLMAGGRIVAPRRYYGGAVGAGLGLGRRTLSNGGRKEVTVSSASPPCCYRCHQLSCRHYAHRCLSASSFCDTFSQKEKKACHDHSLSRIAAMIAGRERSGPTALSSAQAGQTSKVCWAMSSGQLQSLVRSFPMRRR